MVVLKCFRNKVDMVLYGIAMLTRDLDVTLKILISYYYYLITFL